MRRMMIDCGGSEVVRSNNVIIVISCVLLVDNVKHTLIAFVSALRIAVVQVDRVR